MFSTLGVILTVVLGLVSLLATLLALKSLNAAPAARSSKRVSPATNEEPAPKAWESQLAELRAEVVSLSSSFEKVAKAVSRQNSRIAMRERRSGQDASDDQDAPPIGTPKAELLKHYGMSGKVGPEFARAQQALELEQSNKRSN